MADSIPSSLKDWPSLWRSFLLFIVVGYLVQWALQWNKLRRFPGPRGAGLSNWWMVATAMAGRSHLQFYEEHLKHGKYFRIAPNTVMTSDEDLIRKMSARGSPYRRAPWYRAFKFDADHDNVISTIDEDKHNRMRAKRAPGYSGKDNPHLEESVDKVCRSMFDLIERKYLSDNATYRPVDLAKICQYFTLDVITSLSLSHPFGFLETDSDVYGYVKTVDENFPIMSFMSVVPLFSTITRQHWFQRLTLPTVKDRIGLGKVTSVSREIVSSRYGDQKVSEQDMIGSFVKHGLSRDEAADETLLQMVAGSDTVASTLRTLFVTLYTTPFALSSLVAELQPLNKTYPLSDPACIPHTTLLSLPYLNACTKEGLRHHPVATGIQPKTVPSTGDTLPDGTFLPPGTEIGTCTLAIANNPEVWGPDFSLFRPERWIDAPPDKLVQMNRSSDLLFGHARFQCLGMQVAKYELLKCVAEVVRRYDITINNVAEVGGPIRHNRNFGIFLQSGIEAKIVRRAG